MSSDFIKNKFFSKRGLVIGGVQIFLMVLLIARLSYLQFFKFDQYRTQAESNRIKAFVIPPQRGIIFDRNGVPLTENVSSYRVLLYRDRKHNEKDNVDKLAKILNLTERQRQYILEKLKKYSNKPVVSILDNLTWDDLAKVEVNSYDLPGISIESGYKRSYPYGSILVHSVGYVAPPSENEIEKGKSLLFMHPDFMIGKSGIEKAYEKDLRGESGLKYTEVNAFGIPVRTLSTKKEGKGENITLTIDIELQKIVAERIKDLNASVVVMDVHTGEVLAMLSNPSYNPNSFVEGISTVDWDLLISDPKKPLNNKVISAIYPPGSIFKLVVALAALENGIDPHKTVNCKGKTWIGRRKFHCWKEEGHGKVDMVKAIAESCNIYFADIGAKTGIKNISEMARRFGLGQYFDLGLSSASSGNVPSIEWKKEVLDEPWVLGDTVNASIGQGYITTTPLQLAVLVSRIANGGISVDPYLFKKEGVEEQQETLMSKEPITSAENLDIVKEGMFQVTNSRKGSAYWGGKIYKKGFEMSGKTGTAQVISKRKDDLTEEEESNERLKNHGLFVGFAPSNNPKYAIAVVVENGGSGSVAAAPVARDIMLKLQNMYQGG